jgi:pyridoxamine 5'-phosphate oxidase
MSKARARPGSYFLGIPGALRFWKWFSGTKARLADLRRDYGIAGLSEDDAPADDPWPLWERWLAEAIESGLREPNAMIASTVSADGQPSSRMVLLKGVDERGFVFYTNYRSRKAGELDSNPRASLLFPWHELERQVIVCGDVARTSVAESEEYFAKRPLGSQVGAWASDQSRPLASRAELEARVSAAMQSFHGKPVPLPPTWGGFRVRPTTIEFWQGRPSRLHDRLRYTLSADGTWRRERLFP